MKIYTQVIDIALQSPKRFWVAPYSDFKIGVKIVKNGTPVANEFTVKQGSTTLTADETTVDGFTTYTLKSGATGAIEYVVEVAGVAEKQKITQIVTDSTVFDVGGEGGSEPNDGELFIYQDNRLVAKFTANQDTNVSAILNTPTNLPTLSVGTLSSGNIVTPTMSCGTIYSTVPGSTLNCPTGFYSWEGVFQAHHGGFNSEDGDIQTVEGDIISWTGSVEGNTLSATTSLSVGNLQDPDYPLGTTISGTKIFMVDGCSDGSIEFKDADGFVVNCGLAFSNMGGGIDMGVGNPITFRNPVGDIV